ncbi:MAG: hypothetical protein IJ241_08805 [Clostridia bacterium]|nr:hypothetical protein [Clostridia bacterium]MBQ8926463.1 hypothetical protein [Clostridia bacterium]
MNKALKIILLVLLFLAVAVGAVFGYRLISDRQTAAAPIATEGQAYLTTSPNASEGVTAVAEAEEDNLASDGNIEPTTQWPFADRKSESKFEAKESVGHTTTKAAKQNKTKAAEKTAESKKETTEQKASKETTKKSSSASEGNIKAFLQKLQSGASRTNNGHPVKVDSNGVNIEYKKFAVADLNGDGKDEVFLYAESTKGEDFYGNSYIVYDSSLKNVRTTMVIDEFKDVKFYKSGVYEIVENKFGFTSDAIAAQYGVKNENSILGFDVTTTPYLKYMTNGPYIDAPSEISAADYKATVSKLRAGGKLDVKVYDFTKANVEKL